MKATRIRRARPHRLPSTYRIRTSISGYDTSAGYESADHWDLRMMTSQTQGSVPVFIASRNWSNWVELPRVQWYVMAEKIVGKL